ncbi:hypothetical protein KUTeg_001624 [Tegillarca granosa]|uniref:DH domain-containing protein n=1 Tax=Tegillarca granosa TaxID=220873 RepID=A0ABQ9FVL5_TEGGR|nr:hypothetical protein KUTeg_001624 [Tegillarca granosa]
MSQRLSSGNSPNNPDGNSILPPFEHMWKFKSHLEEEDIYIDLNNDSDLYGQLDRRYTTKFESEPLYQIYNKDKITRDSHIHTVQTHSDDESGDERIYEAVDEMFEKVKAGLEVDSKTDNISPSKTVSTLELFGKTGSVLRALWSEMPEVKESGILENISPQERKIQEAMFEIITSEASYLKSVNVLIDVFLMSPEFSSEHSDRCVISRQERHVLFSNIGAVRESSEQFLMDLEGRWQQSVQLSDVCDIIYRHAAKKFDCYVRYCSNQTFQDRATQELMKKQEFAEAVRRFNSNQYVVTDYGPRNALHVEVIDTAESKAKLLPQGVPSGCKNIFLVAMLENHEQKQVEMVLSCKSPSERARWIDALTPVTKHNDNEKIYEEWDCPQVHCINKYIAAEPDELTLEESDVINVFKKMADDF